MSYLRITGWRTGMPRHDAYTTRKNIIMRNAANHPEDYRENANEAQVRAPKEGIWGSACYNEIQGDHSGCSLGFLDNKTKVAFQYSRYRLCDVRPMVKSVISSTLTHM